MYDNNKWYDKAWYKYEHCIIISISSSSSSSSISSIIIIISQSYHRWLVAEVPGILRESWLPWVRSEDKLSCDIVLRWSVGVFIILEMNVLNDHSPSSSFSSLLSSHMSRMSSSTTITIPWFICTRLIHGLLVRISKFSARSQWILTRWLDMWFK